MKLPKSRPKPAKMISSMSASCALSICFNNYQNNILMLNIITAKAILGNLFGSFSPGLSATSNKIYSVNPNYASLNFAD